MHDMEKMAIGWLTLECCQRWWRHDGDITMVAVIITFTWKGTAKHT